MWKQWKQWKECVRAWSHYKAITSVQVMLEGKNLSGSEYHWHVRWNVGRPTAV